jgi:hypothetical protein
MTMCVVPVAPDPSADATAAAAAKAVASETLRLTVAKATATRHLKKRIQQGVAIRRRRLRYAEDLAEARAEKATWVQAYTESLRQMFHGESGQALADTCNNWIGRIYPEYAESGLFVEQFYEDMDYRLSRLRHIARLVEEMVEPVIVPSGSTPVTLVEPRAAQPPSAPSSSPPAARAASQAAPLREDVADAAPEADAPAASGGLLLTHAAGQPAVESLERFLKDLGLNVTTLPAVPQDPAVPAATPLERQPSAAFAVALLGAGADAGQITFQLGYLVGRLGLNRVCVLHEQAGEPRPNLHGIHAFPLDAGGGWHLALARHLKRSGMEVDLNKLC